MLKHLLPVFILSSVVFTSCKVDTEVNPDNGAAIAGTYRMTVYNTQAGNNNNPASGNNLVVTKVDKNTVKVVIDYASGSDVTLDRMAITKNGSIYNLSQSFSNASSSGNINGSTFTLNLNYNDGDYVYVVAVK